jgi:hypothetical protein
MKRAELKKVLKPLIKECIKEVIFEEGVLSGLISEVIRGASVTAIPEKKLLEETISKPSFIRKDPKEYENKLKETKRKIREAIGQGAYNGVNLFEGTDPLKKSGAIGETAVASPLDVYAPGDSGVDISSIVSPNWKKLA